MICCDTGLFQVLPTSKSSQMITFTFANGGVATMRTSGTEPKIKYYSELCAPPGNRYDTDNSTCDSYSLKFLTGSVQMLSKTFCLPGMYFN